MNNQPDPTFERGQHHRVQGFEHLLLPVCVVIAELWRAARVGTRDSLLNLAQEWPDAAVLAHQPVDDFSSALLDELAHLLHVEQLLAVRGFHDDLGGGDLLDDVLDDPRALVDLVDQGCELVDGVGAPFAVLEDSEGVPVQGVEPGLENGPQLVEFHAVEALLDVGEVHGLVVELEHALDRALQVDEVVLREHGLHGHLGNLKVHLAQVIALLDDGVQGQAEVALHPPGLIVDDQDGILEVSQRGPIRNLHPVPVQLLLVLHHNLGEICVLAGGHRGGGFGSHLPLGVPLELVHRLANLAEKAAAPRDGSRHRGLAAVHEGSLVVLVKQLPHVDNLLGELLEDVRHLALDRTADRTLALHRLEVLHEVKGTLRVTEFLEALVDELLGASLDGLLLGLKVGINVGPVGEGLLVEHVKVHVHHELGHAPHAIEHRVDTLRVTGDSLELGTEKLVETLDDAEHAVQVAAYPRDVVGAREQSFGVELPPRVAALLLDLLAHGHVRGPPSLGGSLGDVNLGHGLLRGHLGEERLHVQFVDDAVANLGCDP